MQYFLFFSHKISRFVTAEVGVTKKSHQHQDLQWSEWASASFTLNSAPSFRAFLHGSDPWANTALTGVSPDSSGADYNGM